jgi:hypothetical protein
MPARAVLVVVIVGDAGLRSVLAAQLAVRGMSLLTAGSFGAVPRRRPDEPAILVVDEADMAGERGGQLEALQFDRRWQRVVMLTAGVVPASDRDWLIHVSKNSAVDTIAQVVDELEEIENASLALSSTP